MSSASRNIYHYNGFSNHAAVTALRDELEKICGSAQTPPFQFNGGTYFNVEAEITGSSSDLVVIGAHLDSTAANEPTGYNAYQDPAPGADDDASGVAAVVAVAAALRAIAGQSQPRYTIRFVLFNAEEYWLRGSKAYASALEKAGLHSVVAMVMMDMIGWHRNSSVFEIHSTGEDDFQYAMQGCDQLAGILENAAAIAAPNLIPRRYPLVGSTTDPAHERSDHTYFQLYGWPACVVCEEDGFASGNPNYHRAGDLVIDYGYAADIARTVAQAVWMIANP